MVRGLMRKADAGSCKQNPASPEKHRAPALSLNSASASHLQISFQSRNSFLVF